MYSRAMISPVVAGTTCVCCERTIPVERRTLLPDTIVCVRCQQEIERAQVESASKMDRWRRACSRSRILQRRIRVGGNI